MIKDNLLNVIEDYYFQTSDNLTVWELIEVLNQIEDKNLPVICYDKRNEKASYPWKFISYRGDYNQLALTEGSEEITVKDFLDKLKNVIWKTFTWYKGWEFTMSNNTSIYLANSWEVSWIILRRVDILDFAIVLFWEDDFN